MSMIYHGMNDQKEISRGHCGLKQLDDHSASAPGFLSWSVLMETHPVWPANRVRREDGKIEDLMEAILNLPG
jgi:hypothetical protein